MKKVLFIIFSFFFIVSCTNNDATSPKNTINPKLLKKVVFNPGDSNEIYWYFNSKGLLEKITKADESIIHNFTYSKNDNTLLSIDSNSYTFNINNTIATINGVPILENDLTYNSSENKYILDELNSSEEYTTIDCLLNSEMILTDIVKYMDNNNNYSLGSIGFENSDNVSNIYDGLIGPIYFSYDDKINPLRKSLIPIFRALSIHFGQQQGSAIPDFMIENSIFCSNNNIISQTYPDTYEASKYTYEFNSSNLPKKQFVENYYNGTSEGSHLTIAYYYQGDVIP